MKARLVLQYAVLLTLASVLAALPNAGGNVKPLSSSSSIPGQVVPIASTRNLSNQLLISLANGHLVALDESTGELQWSFDTGSPLITSANPAAAAAAASAASYPSSDSGSTLPAPKEGIFPGTDGSLYVYRPQPSGPPRIEKLPIGIIDLVQLSPAPTPDGSLVLGSQRTSIYVLDAAKGTLLRTMQTEESDGAAQGDATPAATEDDHLVISGDPLNKGTTAPANAVVENVLTIGRKDYIIRAVHPAFGEQWNVSWSSLQHLSSLSVSRGNTKNTPFRPPTPDISDETKSSEDTLQLVVGADHSLRRMDPKNPRWVLWKRRFEAPPLAAYPSVGPPVDLVNAFGPADDASRGGDNSNNNLVGAGNDAGDGEKDDGDQNSKALIPRSDAANAAASVAASGDSLVVGVMKGGLFGMKVPSFAVPAASKLPFPLLDGDSGVGKEEEEEIEKHQPQGASGQCDADDIEDGSSSSSSSENNDSADLRASPSSSTSSTAMVLRKSESSHPWWQDSICRGSVEDSNTCAVPVGLFPVEEQCTDSTLIYLPHGKSFTPDDGSGGGVGAAGGLVGQGVVLLMIVVAAGAVGGGIVVVFIVRINKNRKVESTTSSSGVVLDQQRELQGQKRVAVEVLGKSADDAQTTSIAGPKKSGKKSKKSKNTSTTIATTAAAAAADKGKQDLEQEDTAAKSNSQTAQRSKIIDGVTHVGRLRVGPGILGYGSGGTIVFEGELDGRPVAVKRLLSQFVDLAKKEIGALIVSDEHPNVVRCFAMEEDAEFIYLALEKCTGTLADALLTPAGREKFISPETGQPTAYAMQVAEDVGRGLAALHARGIVHRDLKPHNVLLSDARRAKVSDMGLSKKLVPEQASFETVGIAGGSPGWQAPEQLALRAGLTENVRQTAAVDVFSFGLLIHFCLTGGKHPFGEGVERDAAILRGKISLDAVQALPEARDILLAMLAPRPEARPSVAAVMSHPLWWPAPRRLAFLIDVSDRVEGEDRAGDGSMYNSLEALSLGVIGGGNNNDENDSSSWAAKLDSGLLSNLGKYRRYDFSSLRDLLRVIRNKHSHFRELPSELQERLGPIPDGFLAYFALRFPQLLVTCFYFALRWCPEEPIFAKYFQAGASGLLTTAAPLEIRDPEVEAAAIEAAKTRLAAAAAEARQQRATEAGAGAMNGYENNNTGGTPTTISLPGENVAPPLAVFWDAPTGTSVMVFPRRLGLPPCDFYVKTGHCRYGEACRYDHPPEYAVRLSSQGLPIRPGQSICTYYERNGDCKFGPACRFNHPPAPGGGAPHGLGTGMVPPASPLSPALGMGPSGMPLGMMGMGPMSPPPGYP